MQDQKGEDGKRGTVRIDELTVRRYIILRDEVM